MCGICGGVGVRDEDTLRRMTRTLAHRGPDDEGVTFFADRRVGIGARRLAIIDPTPAGHQPMSNEDGSVWLAFNGEVYNHPSLRTALEREGCSFRSHCDTEVILRQYERDGVDCLPKLRGMFALAVLDLRERRLVLARDRLGIKPLYYREEDGRLTFGSEIKALLAEGTITREIDPQALSDFFTYLYVPCPRTMFRGISQLPPGHVLVAGLDGGAAKVASYGDVLDEPAPLPRSRREGAAALRELLADAVEEQLISDVPLGLFLSGGLDSGVLAALMARRSPEPVRTFTVVFEGPGLEFYDERRGARSVATRLGTEHQEIPATMDDPASMFDLVRFFDQPFGNPTFYLMYLISAAARAETTVALCGAGGDELFAGYPRYRAMSLAERISWVPSPVFRMAARATGLMGDRYRTMTLRRVREFLEGWDADEARRFVNWTYFFPGAQKHRLLADAGAGDTRASEDVLRDQLRSARSRRDGNHLLEADLRSFLVGNVLDYTDKMSMAAGLEVRVPYLDERVVSLALRIPFHEKLRGTTTKAIIREAFADDLPPEVLAGPKRGFNLPLAIWMRDDLDGYLTRAIERHESADEGLLNWSHVRALRQQHRLGRRDNAHELFSVLMFDAWYRRYILEEAPDEPAAEPSH